MTQKQTEGRGFAKGVTQEKIVSVASQIIAETGLDAFRLNDVAHALNVRPSAIYNHFANRDAVVVAVSEKVSRAMIAAALPNKGTSAREKIEFFADGLTAYLHAHPVAARLQLIDIASSSFLELGRVAELDAQSRERLEEILVQGVRDGEFRKVRLEAFRAFMISGVAANVLWHTYQPGARKPTLKKLQQEARDLALRFLACD